MANSIADQNHVRTKLAVLNTDGTTLVSIKADESTGAIKITTVDTVSFTMTPIDRRDEDFRDCLMWVGTDGLTYPAVANASGELLIET